MWSCWISAAHSSASAIKFSRVPYFVTAGVLGAVRNSGHVSSHTTISAMVTLSTLASRILSSNNNDPDKFYLNAVETIIPGSGTGRFANATGTLTTHGNFGISDWITMDGWAIFTSHASVCGASSAS